MVDYNQDLETGGVKRDIGKPRMDLIPPLALLAIGDLFAAGAEKYDDRNWEKGMDQGRVIAALERHVQKYKGGEDFDPDPEAGKHHLIHIAWNAMIGYELWRAGKWTEDQRTKLRSMIIDTSLSTPEESFATGGIVTRPHRFGEFLKGESVRPKGDEIVGGVNVKVDVKAEPVNTEVDKVQPLDPRLAQEASIIDKILTTGALMNVISRVTWPTAHDCPPFVRSDTIYSGYVANGECLIKTNEQYLLLPKNAWSLPS